MIALLVYQILVRTCLIFPRFITNLILISILFIIPNLLSKLLIIHVNKWQMRVNISLIDNSEPIRDNLINMLCKKLAPHSRSPVVNQSLDLKPVLRSIYCLKKKKKLFIIYYIFTAKMLMAAPRLCPVLKIVAF